MRFNMSKIQSNGIKKSFTKQSQSKRTRLNPPKTVVKYSKMMCVAQSVKQKQMSKGSNEKCVSIFQKQTPSKRYQQKFYETTSQKVRAQRVYRRKTQWSVVKGCVSVCVKTNEWVKRNETTCFNPVKMQSKRYQQKFHKTISQNECGEPIMLAHVH